jgi:hypothetical protein
MATPAELLEDAYDDVKADVVAAIKQHPQYAEFVQALANKGITELFALLRSGAV